MTVTTSPDDVRARNDKMVGFARSAMSDKRGTMSNGYERRAGLVGTTLMTADSSRLRSDAALDTDRSREPIAASDAQ